LDSSKSFIDIGANIGTHTIVAEKRGCSILSIEADKTNFALLKKNLSDAHLMNITTLNEYVSDLDGYENKSYWASFGNTQIVDYGKVRKLDSIIDSFGFKPNLIKMDTDGGELKILKGMDLTLSIHSPTLIIEIDRNQESSGQSLNSIQNFLKFKSYQLIGFLDYDNAVFSKKHKIKNKYLLLKSKYATHLMLKSINQNWKLSSYLKTSKYKIIQSSGSKFSNSFTIPLNQKYLNLKITNLFNPINLLVEDSFGNAQLSLTIPSCINLKIRIDLNDLGIKNPSTLCIRNGPLGKSLSLVKL
jgi:FkbM family methyltransferase